MEPLRVVFASIDSADHVSGVTTWLLRLLPKLKDHNISAAALLFDLREAPDSQGYVARTLESHGIRCATTSLQRPVEDLIRWILEQLREQPADVFVPNCIVAAYYAARWVQEASVPAIGVLHSDDAFHHSLQRQFGDLRGWNQMDGWVVASKYLESLFPEKEAIQAARVARIPYGVTLFDPNPLKASNRLPLQIGYVGRLEEEQKRIGLVTAAMVEAANTLPDVRCTFYGTGPEEVAVRNAIARAPSKDRLELRGWVPPEEMARELAMLDVIVLLSDYEGLPVSLLEAMAHGVIPVCSRMRSGIPELVEDGVTGLIIDATPQAFIEAIRSLLNQPGLRQRLSAQARAKVEAEFSLERCVSQWARFLAVVAANSKKTKRSDLRIPRRFNLPPLDPALAREEIRVVQPSLLQRAMGRARRLVSS